MRADPAAMYRLPWTLSDNILSWLAPTSNCQLHCVGCFSTGVAGGHRSLHEIRARIDRIAASRKSEVLGIAGGEPLTHPALEEIVAHAAARGFRPIVMTNGVAMTAARLASLKAAGLKGVYFHVDGLMDRPGWEGASEDELNELRAAYAEMTAAAGGLVCYMSATVADSNLAQVPGLLDWARENSRTVHLMQFNAFRRPAGGAPAAGLPGETSIDDLLASARSADPAFAPCAYVEEGAQNAVRWLISLRPISGGRTLGYLGPRFAEAVQVSSHLLRGKYLAPRRAGGGVVAAASLFEPRSRRAAFAYLGACLSDPRRLLAPVDVQTILFVEPQTLVQDGDLGFF